MGMKALVKIGTVLAGYVAAVLVANAAVAVRIADTSGPDAQASAGMYAFGDGLLFVAVFGAADLVPTGLALWFLRPFRWFWVGLSATAVTFAITAILAASVYAVAACLTLPRESPLMEWAAFAVLRMLAASPLAAVFVLGGVISPGRASRWALLAAAGTEGAVAAYAVLHWFAGCCFIRMPFDPAGPPIVKSEGRLGCILTNGRGSASPFRSFRHRDSQQGGTVFTLLAAACASAYADPCQADDQPAREDKPDALQKANHFTQLQVTWGKLRSSCPNPNLWPTPWPRITRSTVRLNWGAMAGFSGIHRRSESGRCCQTPPECPGPIGSAVA
jgi:hypothetical protein